MAVPPSSIASTEASAPPIFPNGVRAVPRITVFGMRARIVTGREWTRPAYFRLLEVADRQQDASERLVRHSRKRRVPGHHRSRDAEPAACLHERIGAVRLADPEDDEGRRQEEEDEVDRNRDAE